MAEGEVSALDLASLNDWWTTKVDARPVIATRRIAGGHSNLTYRIQTEDGRSYALRRPPLGTVAHGAHDVLREARILRALSSTTVPVPTVVGVCNDTAILGAPFFIMEWVDGHVVDRPAAVAAALPGDLERQQATIRLVDVLAELHAVDDAATGLTDLAPAGRYLERQLGRMWRVWESTRTRDLPAIGILHERLLAHEPAQARVGLVHGDYRFGNVMISPGGAVKAVLDWELASIGDVLCDIAFLLNNWEGPSEGATAWMQEPPTRAGGFPDREFVLNSYVMRTGCDPADLAYYRAFSYWRMAIIAEGIKRRYESGAMIAHAVDIGHLERRVRRLAELADEMLSGMAG